MAIQEPTSTLWARLRQVNEEKHKFFTGIIREINPLPPSLYKVILKFHAYIKRTDDLLQECPFRLDAFLNSFATENRIMKSASPEAQQQARVSRQMVNL